MLRRQPNSVTLGFNFKRKFASPMAITFDTDLKRKGASPPVSARYVNSITAQLALFRFQ